MKKLLLVISCAALTACGSGSGSSSSGSGSSSTQLGVSKNVALSSNGGKATATYAQADAANVIDGDKSAAKVWTGSTADDAVTVELDKTYKVSKIVVHLNNSIFSSQLREKYIEVSTDGSTWKETSTFKSTIACSDGLSMRYGVVSCSYTSPLSIKYVRVRLARDNSSINVHEIEVIVQ